MSEQVARPVPHGGAPSPEGYHYEAIEECDNWRIGAVERRCRFTVGPNKKQCGRPGVARLKRGRAGWWGYCERHLYGKWIEDGKVMTWRLAKNDGESQQKATPQRARGA